MHATGNPREHVPTRIGADLSGLSEENRAILPLLLQAVCLTNPVYLRQTNQDLIATHGVYDKSRGNHFYPEGVTKEEIESFLAEHPAFRSEILSPVTVVERNRDGVLRGSMFVNHHEYEFSAIHHLLKQAAEITSHPEFAAFLQKRAQSFVLNGFKKSDEMWVQLPTDIPFELTIGPFEEYEDSLMGLKRSVEGVLGLPIPKANARLAQYTDWTTRFDASLGERYGYEPKTGLSPMLVMDLIMAGGHALYGYVAMAYNLPNDQDIQREIGSKKVFMRNVLRAKFETMDVAIADAVLSPEDRPLMSPEAQMHFVLGHELSHGLTVRFDGENFGNISSPMEEGKADVFGNSFLYFLAEHGKITEEEADAAVVTNITDALRQFRLGLNKPHAAGSLFQYQWMIAHRALRIRNGKLEYFPQRFRESLATLSDELARLSASNSQSEAQEFLDVWGQPPTELPSVLEGLEGIPFDIDPVFHSFE